MGFFDRFKKAEERGDSGTGNILQEIISAYGLKKATPYEPSIEQDWWEGYYGTMRLAVQEHGRGIIAYLGDVVEVTEIYLGRVSHTIKLPPPGSPQRLDRIVGAEGGELARHFILLSHPKGGFDYPQLRLPELRHGITRLSGSVGEIAIYENFRGLSLIYGRPVTRSDFDSDLGIASDMVKALSLWVGKTGQQ